MINATLEYPVHGDTNCFAIVINEYNCLSYVLEHFNLEDLVEQVTQTLQNYDDRHAGTIISVSNVDEIVTRVREVFAEYQANAEG